MECTPYGMGGDTDDTIPSNDRDDVSGAFRLSACRQPGPCSYRKPNHEERHYLSDDESAELLELPAPHTDNTDRVYALKVQSCAAGSLVGYRNALSQVSYCYHCPSHLANRLHAHGNISGSRDTGTQVS